LVDLFLGNGFSVGLIHSDASVTAQERKPVKRIHTAICQPKGYQRRAVAADSREKPKTQEE
jgi:hypothetical protein